MSEMSKNFIRISRSVHGTADVVVYTDRTSGVFDWFRNLDVWGSYGYDRFNDGGLYFELPINVAKILRDIPAIQRMRFVVYYEGPESFWFGQESI